MSATELVSQYNCGKDYHSFDVFGHGLQENVLLDSDGHIKVTDFGLAKPGLSDDVRTNSFIGTMEVG